MKPIGPMHLQFSISYGDRSTTHCLWLIGLIRSLPRHLTQFSNLLITRIRSGIYLLLASDTHISGAVFPNLFKSAAPYREKNNVCGTHWRTNSN